MTNAEMKEIMLFACRRLEELLRLKEENPWAYYAHVIKYGADYCGRWER